MRVQLGVWRDLLSISEYLILGSFIKEQKRWDQFVNCETVQVDEDKGSGKDGDAAPSDRKEETDIGEGRGLLSSKGDIYIYTYVLFCVRPSSASRARHPYGRPGGAVVRPIAAVGWRPGHVGLGSCRGKAEL